jgi:hypothetical protein
MTGSFLTHYSRALPKLLGLIVRSDMKLPALYGLCCVHNSPPLLPILSQTDPTPPNTISLQSFPILSSYRHLRLPRSLFPLGFPTKLLINIIMNIIKVNVLGLKLKVFLVSPSSSLSSHILPLLRLVLQSQPR